MCIVTCIYWDMFKDNGGLRPSWCHFTTLQYMLNGCASDDLLGSYGNTTHKVKHEIAESDRI